MLKDTDKKEKSDISNSCNTKSCCYKLAELPDSCQSKIHEFEQELNKHGYWNIAIVAYQKIE